MAMISVTHLRKDYDGGLVQALRGVSFEIEKGEAVSIMGPSGCGKSTLLNLIGTLDAPTAGFRATSPHPGRRIRNGQRQQQLGGRWPTDRARRGVAGQRHASGATRA